MPFEVAKRFGPREGHDYGAEKAQAWDRAAAHLTAIRSGGAQVIPMLGKRA